MILFSLVHIERNHEKPSDELIDLLRSLAVLGEVWLAEFPQFAVDQDVWRLHLIARPLLAQFEISENEISFTHSEANNFKKVWVGDYDCLVNTPKDWTHHLSLFRHYEFYHVQ